MKLPTSFFSKIWWFWAKMAILWQKGCNFLRKMRFWAKYWMYRKNFFFLQKINRPKTPQKFGKKFLPKIAQNPPRFGKMPFFRLFMDLGWCVGQGSTRPSIKKFFSWPFNTIFFPKEVSYRPVQNPKSYFKKTPLSP